MANGVDGKKRIIGTDAPHPLLYNIPLEYIERFRQQITVIDLRFRGNPELIRKAVWSCYQEEPVEFEGQTVYDIGAYSEAPMSGKITERVTEPWKQPQNEKEREAVQKMQDLMDRLKNRKQADDEDGEKR